MDKKLSAMTEQQIILLRRLLETDSTSGRERGLSEMLSTLLPEWFVRQGGTAPVLSRSEVGDGSENLLFSWGVPRVVFCTHMDTVPPYIAPVFAEDRVLGRGSNDAKGQLFSFACACARLAAAGEADFGLLLVSGEETGSYGAKAFAKTDFRAPYLIVGEPTRNKMVSASKGTKSYKIHIGGRRCHSGYPEHGVSAVDIFNRMLNALSDAAFPEDPVLGPTTWNVGRLSSDNAQNILSDSLDCRLYFRTTFASDSLVRAKMEGIAAWEFVDIEALGGDIPREYLTLEGFESAPVSFGSDAPHLSNFEYRAICGPGDILTAHTPDEYVLYADLDTAVDQYVRMFETLKNRSCPNDPTDKSGQPEE